MTTKYIKFNGAVYTLITSSARLQQEDIGDPDSNFWYIGDLDSTEYHPANFDYVPFLDADAVEELRSAIESAYRLVLTAAKKLQMSTPLVFLVDLSDSRDVAKYMDGSRQVLLLDPDKHPSTMEIELSLLHELGHAYLEMWGRCSDYCTEEDEDVVEHFAQQYHDNPTTAIKQLKRNAKRLVKEIE